MKTLLLHTHFKKRKLAGIIIFYILFPNLISSGKLPPPLNHHRGTDDGQKKMTVVIDAGHGGKDPGCIGFSGKTNESQIALGIALKLGKLIAETMEDVNVIYTRQTDTFVELHQRASIANHNNAALFICIHCNSNKVKKVNGTETYVMGMHVSEQNLDVAKRENEAILMEENYQKRYEGFDPKAPEANIVFSLYQNAYLEQSLQFAGMVQNQLRKRASRTNRGVRQAGFVVLFKTTMPSVLIEAGFLSNQEEEQYLASDNGQEETARAIFFAFKDFALKSRGEVPRISQEQGIFFRVQIATSSKPIPFNAPDFQALETIEEYVDEGIYKYTVGGPQSELSLATNLQVDLRRKGFQSAFIVAFNNGKRIPLLEAFKLKEEPK